MKRSIYLGAVAILLLTAAGGYVFGYRNSFFSELDTMSLQAHGELLNDVEALARLRSGVIDGGISVLEGAVDRVSVALLRRHEWAELSEGLQGVLMATKTYRTAYPPESGNGPVSALLARVPMLPEKHDYCSPAMQEVLRRAREAGE